MQRPRYYSYGNTPAGVAILFIHQRPTVQIQDSSSNNAFASRKSTVSKPSVNQP